MLSLPFKSFYLVGGSKASVYVKQMVNSAKECMGETQTKQPGAQSPGHAALPWLLSISLLTPHPLVTGLEGSSQLGSLSSIPWTTETTSACCHTPLMSQMESFESEQGSRLSLSLLCPFGFCELDHWIFTRSHP